MSGDENADCSARHWRQKDEPPTTTRNSWLKLPTKRWEVPQSQWQFHQRRLHGTLPNKLRDL